MDQGEVVDVEEVVEEGLGGLQKAMVVVLHQLASSRPFYRLILHS